MSISTIAFDAYGTLFDTSDGSLHATERILNKRGCKLNPDKVYSRWKAYNQTIIATSPVFRTEAEIFVEGRSPVFVKLIQRMWMES